MMILSRIGPQLPRIAEEALIRHNNPAPAPKQNTISDQIRWMALGAALVGVGVWLSAAL
jgi:ubiquinone biosynthesis protein